ncbi:MAG: TetM/TetW/TetO/TetS family tetracycline resistance ribosomal protection protein, partial [Chloroflexota bacterium]|nr:TetM/TetW/TetO/TetS family tetracycline resistance ribosomal protection protein [Chloroflexota bacterium]
IGILAHVDAGKTSLTEQILYHAGVIPSIGRVDHGNTHTDTLELERARGITIQSAVVSFRIGDLKVNLIDTPGHPDFIAEVERALRVLDGVVLVISAVEGVQAQTRRLAQAIRSLNLPLILFANKIDRRGAREPDLLDEIQQKLDVRVVALNTVTAIGSPGASVLAHASDDHRFIDRLTEVLTEHDDRLLDCYLRNRGHVPFPTLRDALTAQTRHAHVSPLFFGSAMTGAGVTDLLKGIARFLPPAPDCDADPLSGEIFKIQRGRGGEKIVYARLHAGAIRARQSVIVGRADADDGSEQERARITGIDAFDEGDVVTTTSAKAGDIVRLHGLKDARIGDTLGTPKPGHRPAAFPPPVLESVVRPADPALRHRLNAALADLADHDPLISVRRDTARGLIAVRLYGEVQKEVIAATLENEFGVCALFEPSQVIHVERPVGCGSAVELMGPGNPFAATVGLSVAAAPDGSGLDYRRQLGSLPLSFYTAIEETVRQTLEEGFYGWNVIDLVVEVTHVGFSSPVSVAADFRHLTPLVLMEALRRAGTRVHEPIERFELDVPDDCLREVLNALGGVRGVADRLDRRGDRWRVSGTIPSTAIQPFERRLPGFSRGEADFETRFDSFAPVTGAVPLRERIGLDALNRKEYFAHVSQM